MLIYMYVYTTTTKYTRRSLLINLENFCRLSKCRPIHSLRLLFLFSHTNTHKHTHAQTDDLSSCSLPFSHYLTVFPWPSSSASKSNNSMPANRHNKNDTKFIFYFLHLFAGTLTLALTSPSTLTSPSAWEFVVVSFYKNIYFSVYLRFICAKAEIVLQNV